MKTALKKASQVVSCIFSFLFKISCLHHKHLKGNAQFWFLCSTQKSGASWVRGFQISWMHGLKINARIPRTHWNLSLHYDLHHFVLLFGQFPINLTLMFPISFIKPDWYKKSWKLKAKLLPRSCFQRHIFTEKSISRKSRQDILEVWLTQEQLA